MIVFALICVVAIIALTAQGIFIKLYGEKRQNAELTYSFVSALFAFLMFSVISLVSKQTLNPESVPYSLLFSLCYAGATITYVLAIACGSLAITTTIYSFALIIPTFLGFFIWNEPINIYKIIGIVFFAVSILLVGEKDENSGQKMSVKWIVLVCISFVFEGLAPVAIKLHENALGSEMASVSNNTFLTLAYGVAFFGILFAALIKEGRGIIEKTTKSGKVKKVNFLLDSMLLAVIPASLGGAFNGLYNIMNSVVAAKYSVSVYFPVISAGQMILTCVLAVVMFKEKLSKKQYLAIFFGAVAIVLLNI